MSLSKSDGVIECRGNFFFEKNGKWFDHRMVEHVPTVLTVAGGEPTITMVPAFLINTLNEEGK